MVGVSEWFAEETGERVEEAADQGSYYYLAGPMSGYPNYNFPEFDRIAGNLRSGGYTIVSPAELDVPEVRQRAEASESGQDPVGMAWEDCLRRDVALILDPRCDGVVVINGWENSKGARLETYVAASLGLQLLRYVDYDDGFDLQALDRDAALDDHERLLKVIAEHVTVPAKTMDVSTVKGYCVYCRKKTRIAGAREVTMKNGRPAIQGRCPDCNRRIFKIGALR